MTQESGLTFSFKIRISIIILSPRNRIIIAYLLAIEPVIRSSCFYRTLITILTKARFVPQLSLICYALSHFCRCILISSLVLCYLTSGLFLRCFLTKILYSFLISSPMLRVPQYPPSLIILMIVGEVHILLFYSSSYNIISQDESILPSTLPSNIRK